METKDRYYNLLKESKCEMYVQKKADILRMFLMLEFGGVWFDISTIMVQDLSWLDDLKSQNGIVNKRGEHPQTLVCSYPVYGGDKRV